MPAKNKKCLLEMSDEELREISMKKNKRGVATAEALCAQEILWERNGEQFRYDDYRRADYDY